MADLAKGNIENPELTIDEEELPKFKAIDNVRVLRNLLNFKQIVKVGELMENMRLKVMEQKKPLFDVWMKQESDLIQEVGQAYGDQLVFNHCANMVEKQVFGDVNGKIMERVVVLYGLYTVRQN